LAIRLLQVKQLSQSVSLLLRPFCARDAFLQAKAIRLATQPPRLFELAQRKRWQDRLVKRAQEVW
jgi:hypothetical protein